MTMWERFREWLEEQLANLSKRERVLLLILFGVLGSGIVLVSGYSLSTRLSDLEAGNRERRALLREVHEQSSVWRQQAEEMRRVQEQLADNRLRLSSFIESRATRLRIASPTGYTDRQNPREGGIVAIETTAQFQGVDIGQLDELLNEFQTTDELVYIQEVTVEPPRGRGTEGLQVKVTLVTYQRASEGGAP
jgi:hypothetical protein